MRRFLSLFRGRRIDRELDEEIRGHYDELREALEHEGHAPAEAARLARLRLGGAVQIRESSHDEWRIGWLDGVGCDVRIAVRSLRRRPGFFLAGAATLALGIGAATAIFSVAYGIALRPLPYPDAARLVRIYEANLAKGLLKHDVSIGAFQEWRKGARSLAGVALFTKTNARSVAGPDGARLVIRRVSPAFFDVLGVRPVLGPGFKREDQYTRFTLDDVVLSYETWQRLFGGKPAIGATVTLSGAGDDDPFTVVGVLPKDFAFLEPADLWTPLMMEEPLARRLRADRGDHVIARLKPGATIERARAELDTIAARLAVETPAASAGWTADATPLHDAIVGDFRRATWLLLVAVAVVLLVACLNVGGLLVARAVSRERETAVRVSLGAGAWRLVRQWLVEASLMCGVGAALGVGLAWLGVTALKAAAPPGIPRLEAVAIDGPTLVIALLSMALAVAFFTVAPLGRETRRERSVHLRTRSNGAAGQQAMRAGLTAAQCAGAAALVILAVMLTRSFVKLTSFDLGWNATRVLSVQAMPNMPRELRRPWFARVGWADHLIQTLEATPGVEQAAVTTQLPLGPAPVFSAIGRGRGKKAADEGRWSAAWHKVTDGYFGLMEMRLVEGRLFGRDDRFTEAQMTQSEVRPESGVAVVTRQTARTLWPGEPAIGRSVWLDFDSVAWRTVVGVVDDIQFGAVGEAPGLHLFLPWTQDTASARIYALVKTAGSAASMAAAARTTVQTSAPGATVDRIATLESLVAGATAQPRFTSRVVALFGVLALALAAVGVYGTLSYLVATRSREIGIRVALGASRERVWSDILGRGLTPAAAGGVAGVLVALAVARAFRGLLFGVEPLDPASIAAGAVALAAVAVAAALGPARHASRVDPAIALRVD